LHKPGSENTKEAILLQWMKRLLFWNYARNTWQWDVLCVVILAFIFLTPKGWFANSERTAIAAHRTGAIETVLLSPGLLDDTRDKSKLEEQVKRLTGRDQVEVVEARPKLDPKGRLVAYEVDIR
jgi:hypothetical protein